MSAYAAILTRSPKILYLAKKSHNIGRKGERGVDIGVQLSACIECGRGLSSISKKSKDKNLKVLREVMDVLINLVVVIISQYICLLSSSHCVP